MWVEARRFRAGEARALGEEMRLAPEDIDALVLAVEWSDPALVLTFDSRPFVLCGFIPLAALSLSAYAWMHWTPEIYDRPVAATRKCIEVFTEMKKKYARIYGQCSYGDRPVALLKRLGAKFSTAPDGTPTYIIEA